MWKIKQYKYVCMAPFFTTLVGYSIIGQEITFTQNHVVGGLIGGLLTMVFFFAIL
jgi:hypothetical protein